jgi:hypothetical protein
MIGVNHAQCTEQGQGYDAGMVRYLTYQWYQSREVRDSLVLSPRRVTGFDTIFRCPPFSFDESIREAQLAASRQNIIKKNQQLKIGKTLHHGIMAVGGKDMLDAAEYITRGTYT